MISNLKNILLGVVLLVATHLFSQPFNTAINSPSIPSGAAMNYGKQAEINANFYTGAAGYSLPLCSVQDATVSHGIGLTYNSSFRVSEIASNVGLGFHLNAGGLVTRTILSLEDDDATKGFYHNGSTLNVNDFGDSADGDIDSESDIYTFSAGGLVGKFVFDNTQNIKMLPQSDVKVTVLTNPDNSFKGFKIQSPDGMIYHFGYHPHNSGVSALEYATVNGEEQLISWMLMRIESFDTYHGIDFEYAINCYKFASLPYCTKTGYRNSGNTQFTPDCDDTAILTKIDGHIIKKIISPTKVVTFNLFDRIDLNSCSPSVFSGMKGINQVKIESGDFCYQYDLIQDYFEANLTPLTPSNYRLQLKEVRKKACDASVSEPAFIFDYYGTINSNGSHFFPSMLDKNRDHWDFYNYRYDQTNPTDNNDFDDLIPTANVVTANGNVALSSSVNRESYHNAQVLGALKRVSLPSKGYVEIDYESNEYFKYGGTPVPVFSLTSCSCHCGGIHTDDHTILMNEALVETGQWELCIEPFIDVPECTGYSTTSNEARMNVYDNLNRLHSTVAFDSETETCITGNLSDLVNLIVGGLQAGESYRFEVRSNNASARLNLSYLAGGTNHTAGGLRVKKTTTYTGNTNTDGSENHDKDIINTYEYKDADDPTRSSGVLFNQPKYAFSLNEYSVLFTSSSVLPLSSYAGYHLGYSNTVIKENGNGSQQYRFYMEDSTEVYDDYPIEPVPIRVEAGVLAEQKVIHQNGTVETSSSTQRSNNAAYDEYNYVSGFTFKAQHVPTFNGSTLINDFTHHIIYQPRTGLFLPGTVTTTKDGVSTTTNYAYHPTIIAPTVITSTNSDGKTTEQRMDYTIDHPSIIFRHIFQNENRIALPLETKTYVAGNLLSGSRTNFAFFDPDGHSPNEIFLSGGIIRPYTTSRFERTWRDGELQNGLWNIQEYIEGYTINGMMASWRKAHWDNPETYTYQNRLLTSKSYLGFTESTEYYPNNSALVKKVTAVDGTSQSVVYDGILRPKTVTDDCKNIVSNFDYHFRTSNTDHNYVKTTTTFPTVNANSDLTSLVNFTYKDGLGRDKVTVQKGQGPDNATDDIVIAIDYDNRGRPFKQYEPQIFSTNNGAYQAPQAAWEFSETTFYPSPLNRKHTVTPTDWHTTTYEYGANVADDGIPIDSTNTLYADGELFKTTVIDANNHKSISFSDKKGRTIVSRRTDNGETTGLNFDTKYIFDDKDRRVYTLPPNTDISQKDLLFFCEYDREDRKSKEYHPGKAMMRYFYNDRDLLIARRDGYIDEHPDYRYYVYKYDLYGRELKSGFYNSNLLSPDFGHEPTTPLIETIYGTAAHEKDKVKTVKTSILDGGNNWLENTNTYNTCGLVTSQSSNNHKSLTAGSETTSIAYDGADNPITVSYNHQAYSNNFDIVTTETIDYAGRARESRFQANNSPAYTINSKFYDEKEQLIKKLQGGTGLSGNLAWLQQCDYSYLENGLLHKINGDNLTGTQRALMDCPKALPTPSNPSLSNLDNKDLFYLELAYDIPFSGTSAIAQNNGNITGVKWQVRGREKQGFSLQYDLYNRLTNADYFDENAVGLVDESGIYDVDMTYDKRGNIKTLSRYGVTPTETCLEETLIDQLDYTYADSNHLALVTDAAPCPTNKYLQPTIDNSELHAVGSILTADNLINSSMQVTYQAGQEIRLMEGFHVPAGMGFTAKIGPCPQGGFETGGYTQKNTTTNQYDINGNLKSDPQKTITNTFNHLDLPELITLEDGKTITFTYDAAGMLLIKVLKDNTGAVLETRDYIGGTEYVDGVLESIYHAEGRLHYVNSTPQMEYTTVDHLGNTRLSYADLNGNGIIETPSEILDEVHYYPNGLKMEGYWMNSDNFRYTFNGIEEVDDFGLGVNMATFRTLDPELGRWWSVDPKATVLMGLSPYNSMNNSPIVFNDPNGDIAPIAIAALIGAGVGGAANVYDKWNQIDNGWDFAAAFGIGAAGGAATGAIGFYSGGAGLLKGAAFGGLSGVVGDGLTQIGNGLYFGDSYNGNRTLAAGALGGVIGGITGALTKVPIPAGEKAVREEVFGEFIDTYANSTASGGGKSIKGSLWGGNKSNSSFINTLDEPLVVSAVRTGNQSGLIWGKNSIGHLIKHRDVLGLGNVSAQQAQKMLPQLRGAANQLLDNANPALTRVGAWNTIQNAKMYISNGKMLVTRSNGEFLTIINKTANKWYNAAKLLR